MKKILTLLSVLGLSAIYGLSHAEPVDCPARGVLVRSSQCERITMRGKAVIQGYFQNDLTLAPGQSTNTLTLKVENDKVVSKAVGKKKLTCPSILCAAAGDKTGKRIKIVPLFMECYEKVEGTPVRFFVKGKTIDPQDSKEGVHNMAFPMTTSLIVQRNYRVNISLEELIMEIVPVDGKAEDDEERPASRVDPQKIPTYKPGANTVLPPEKY